jgi:hypothetical protein
MPRVPRGDSSRLEGQQSQQLEGGRMIATAGSKFGRRKPGEVAERHVTVREYLRKEDKCR